ncbi:hypothetical protein B0H14DRAFT_2610500 [Mycena olivaceomarginata]|nr:hypothetical protein B0H14DRAFT_2610500 [Mycena olivaceomarginata]
MSDFPFAQRLGYLAARYRCGPKSIVISPNCLPSLFLVHTTPSGLPISAIAFSQVQGKMSETERRDYGALDNVVSSGSAPGQGRGCANSKRTPCRRMSTTAPCPVPIQLLVLHQGIPRHFPDSDASESPVQLLSVSPVRCFNIYHSGCQYGGHYFARSVDNWLRHLTSLPTPVVPSLFANPFSGPEFCHHNHFPTSTHPSPLFLRWLYFILPLTMDMEPPARMTVYPREKEPQDEVPMFFVADYHETLLCIGFNTRIEGERYLDYIQTWTWQIGVPVSFANRLIFARSEGIYLVSSTVTDTIPGYTPEHLNFELPMDYFLLLSQLASYLAVHGRVKPWFPIATTFEQSSDSSAPIDGSCPSALRYIQRKDGEWIALNVFKIRAY